MVPLKQTSSIQFQSPYTLFCRLFSATDTLMNEFLPDPPSIAFQTNMTSFDQARQVRFPSIVYTGAGDVKNIQKTIEWRGYTDIDWAYPNYTLQVHGCTEMGSNRTLIYCYAFSLQSL